MSEANAEDYGGRGGGGGGRLIDSMSEAQISITYMRVSERD